MDVLQSEWTQRILFSLVVVGALLTLFGGFRAVDATLKLQNNEAHQIRQEGGELNVNSAAAGQGIMMADIERRDLLQTRGQMVTIAGIGLAIIGLGWLGNDFRRARLQRRKDEQSKTVDSAQQVT